MAAEGPIKIIRSANVASANSNRGKNVTCDMKTRLLLVLSQWVVLNSNGFYLKGSVEILRGGGRLVFASAIRLPFV
jgi:hypothetical protein